MELEPGYLVREEMPFGRRVSHDGLLEGLADALVGVLHDSDTGLAILSARVGDDVPADLDAHYERTAGVAEQRTDDEIAAGAQSQAHPLLTAGGDVDMLRGDVIRYLPQPEAPVSTNFIDPPDPSLIGQGRGFDSIGKGGDGGGGGGGGDTGGGGVTMAWAREHVRDLYLELLEREPDEGGWDLWSTALYQGTHTYTQVREAFLASDEYKQKHGG